MMSNENPSANCAKIFVRNVTILDCALLHKRAGPRGRSWHVDIVWEGLTDSHGIVFDFSLAKKAAKEAIDRFFDHRLVVPESCVTSLGNGRALVRSQFELNSGDTDCGIFALNTYTDALAIVPDNVVDALSSGNKTELFSNVLAQAVHQNSPENISRVVVHLREHEDFGKENYFSYTHSLREHFGNCQRFHGHSNIVEIFSDAKLDPEAARKVARIFDARYLVPPCYVVQQPTGPLFEQMFKLCPEIKRQPDLAFVTYEGSQGQVALALPAKIVLQMPAESTIENIAQFVHTHASLLPHQIVVAYEGLAKGSMYP